MYFHKSIIICRPRVAGLTLSMLASVPDDRKQVIWDSPCCQKMLCVFWLMNIATSRVSGELTAGLLSLHLFPVSIQIS